MPPRLNLLTFSRSIPYRPKVHSQCFLRSALRPAPSQARAYSDSKEPPAADGSKRIDSKPLPHVSEEAAKMAEITGSEGPDLSQGTPIEEVVKNDKSAQDKLPKVLKDAIKTNSNGTPKGSRSYSTTTTPINGNGDNALDMGLMGFNQLAMVPETPGLKFAMPTLPLPKDGHVKHRYDPVVEQVTNLLMRHGQKSVAQKVRQSKYDISTPRPKLSLRTWRSYYSSCEHRRSQKLAQIDLFFPEHHHPRISLLTLSCISHLPSTR